MRILAATALLSLSVSHAQEREWDRKVKLNFDPGPSPALTPEDELATFKIVDGFRIELVASDPMIEDPVGIRFDEEGRLWVLEMRGFMLDIKSTGDKEPIGRVSILEDTDGDGRMDQSTVFLDGLVLPRALCITRDGALIAEHDKLWFAKDTDGDLVADEKELVDPEYASSGSVEHRANGLLMAVDNWIYNARSEKRYRFVDGKWTWESIQSRGQWGICQDDWGRLYYNFNWSQLHCDLAPPRSLTRNPNHTPALGVNHALTQDLRVWPIRMNTAVNRAYRPGILDDKGRLREFASACSPRIYRGGQFPAKFNGNAFVCAPGANLVKRLIVEDGLYPTAKNAYDGHEFLASTDERFRPVALEGGPDGGLYIVDMYRGVIQQGEFMTEHLRQDSLKRDLVEPVHLGRIWRVVAEGREQPRSKPMSGFTNQQLLESFESENGWVRDTAQRLLVEREASEVADALRGPLSERARFHVLSTLDRQPKRPHFSEPQRRLQAILDARDPDRIAVLSGLAPTSAHDPLFRDAIVASAVGIEKELIEKIEAITEWGDEPAMKTGRQLLLDSLATTLNRKAGEPVAPVAPKIELTKSEQESYDTGRQLYAGLCAACHGANGEGLKPLAPPLVNSEWVSGSLDRLGRILYQGMEGPVNVNGASYAPPNILPAMPPLRSMKDGDLAKILTYVRVQFGDGAEPVTSTELRRIRDTTTDRLEPWTEGELRLVE